MIKIRGLLRANLPLKTISCIIGYGLWSILSSSYPVNLSTSIPLCFYNVPATMSIKGPEYVTVTLSGNRNSIRNLDYATLAIHIDASAYASGMYAVHLDEEKLFLPLSIKLLDYYPSNIIVHSYYNKSDIQTN